LDALYYIVIFIFVLVCLMLVGIILMQSSQSGGMGSALAGNSALNNALGGQGADKLLVRITATLATLFMILALALNVMSAPGSNDLPSSSSDSILNRNKLESIDSNTISVPAESQENNSENPASE